MDLGELVVEELSNNAGLACAARSQDHDSVIGFGVRQFDSGTGAVGTFTATVVHRLKEQ